MFRQPFVVFPDKQLVFSYDVDLQDQVTRLIV